MKRRIFIIDNDEGLLEMLRLPLVAEGHNVVTSNRLDMGDIYELTPDLILLSLSMVAEQKLNAAFFRRLKAGYREGPAPQMLLTGGSADEALAGEMGADGFIPKPDVAAFWAEIGAWL